MKLIPIDSHHVEHPFQKEMLEKLWQPITIAGVTSKNRIALAPVDLGNPKPMYPEMDEKPILFHEAISKGGTGIVIIGEADVTPNSKFQLEGGGPRHGDFGKGIWSDDSIPGWTRMFDACHKWGATAWPQLSSHPSWYVRPQMVRGGGKATVTVPSWKESGMTPEALEEEKKNLVDGALRAKKIGADGVQLHGTRDHIVAQLISELKNPGVPGYSEDFKARVRWGVECIREIKVACGKDFPVMQRLSGAEYISGGYNVDYAKLVAKEYVDAGVDAIDIAQASHATQVPQLQMVAPSGSFAYMARTVKSYLASLGPPYSEVTILSTCRIQNPWLAASMLRNGDCDVVSLCRQLIVDPDWANKIKEGRIGDIIPCIGCAWCQNHRDACTVNPMNIYYKSPEEYEKIRPTKAKEVKKVLVVGGGVAGMIATQALALRGHKVTLYEKGEDLGRMLHVQSLTPFRSDMDLTRKYLSTQVRKLGVDVRCNQEVTAALIEKEKPDTAVVATGCRPGLPEIPGINRHPNVVSAEDVLLEKVDVGKRVVVIDADPGHDLASLGSFTAQFVARSACVRDDIAMFLARWSPYSPEEAAAMSNMPVGRQVTIVTRKGRIAEVHFHHFTTMADLRRMGVKVLVGCEYKEINDKGLVIAWGGERGEELLEADTIITANYESNNKLYKELEGKVPELHLIGDAKAVRIELIATIQEAYRSALTI
ncbi:FAD-dependent oxidoreductase [Chloroflexota bacterium]